MIAVLAIVILGVASFMIKSDYAVDRTTTIDAPKSQVYATLSDFSQFTKWDPWSKMDPNMTVEYYGEPGTIGHGYKWSGNDSVGTGSMEIINMGENTIEIQLSFMEPYESSSPTSYTITETEEGTSVTWSMTGEVPMAMKMFMDMEAMIGNDFDNGLSNLKSMMESMEAAPEYTIQSVDMPNMTLVGMRQQVKISEMDAFWSEENIGGLYAALGQAGVQSGHLVGVYYSWDEANDMSDQAIAVVVPEGTALEGYETMMMPAGSAVKTTHHGSWDNLDKAHMALEAHCVENDIPMGVAMHVYTVSGEDVPEEEQVTEIYYPTPAAEGEVM